MKLKTKVKKSVEKVKVDLKRKRTVQGFLNYPVFVFGDETDEYFMRLTKKPLLNHRHVSLRYIALIDVFVLIGVFFGLLGNNWGWIWALFFFMIAVVVFVDRNEIERRKRLVTKTVKKPVKATIEVVKKTPKTLEKIANKKL